MLLDVKFAWRSLKKTPSFTLVVLLTLALGIGATTTLFSVVNAVLLKPLAMREPSRVMYVQEEWRGHGLGSFSIGNFIELRRRSRVFSSLAASSGAAFTLATGDTPQRIPGELVTFDYFSTFDVQQIAGRAFTQDEDQPGQGQVVVISERLWRGRLHSDPNIVGQTLRINDKSRTVVGVMPASFDPLLRGTELWLPAGFTPEQLADFDDRIQEVIGRLQRGFGPTQAQEELNGIARQLVQEHPFDNEDHGLRLTPLTTALLGDKAMMLRLLMAAAVFVLLIVCANITNLQLVRARSRRKEIALRAALGAAPRHIVGQMLMENVALGLVSGALGVALAYWGTSWVAAFGPGDVPRLAESRIDGGTLMFAGGVSLLSSLLFGLVPALRSGSQQLSEAFKSGANSGESSRDILRSALVIGEIALALMLLAGAGLLVRSALAVGRVNLGFDASNVVVGRIALPGTAHPDSPGMSQTFERIGNEMLSLAGVESVGLVSRAPLTQGNTNGLIPEGKSVDLTNVVMGRLQVVSPGYLSTARIALQAGRGFTAQDTSATTLVAIVNRSLARSLFPGENPIGKRFSCCGPWPTGGHAAALHEIVGVVGDVKALGLDQQTPGEFYLPLAQAPPYFWDWNDHTMDVMLRARGEPPSAHQLQTAVTAVTPGVPIYDVSSMAQRVSRTLERSHFDTFLLLLFAGIALLLASIGVYGVLSYTVAQRTREIGIRVALGETQGQVMGRVLKGAMKLAICGLVLGLAGALIGARLLSSLLYGVQATDPTTLIVASAVLAAVTMIASYLPARRAMAVDPLVALRAD